MVIDDSWPYDMHHKPMKLSYFESKPIYLILGLDEEHQLKDDQVAHAIAPLLVW